MRLLYFVLDPGIRVGGPKGAAVHVEEITRTLAGRGHTVRIVAVSREEWGSPSCPVDVVPFAPEHRRTVSAVREMTERNPALGRLDRDLRAMLLGSGSTPFLREMIQAHAPDAVLERLSLFGSSGLAACRAEGVPHAVEMNAPLAEEARLHRELSFPEAALEMEREVLQQTDLVFPVSRELASHCHGLGVDPARVHVVGNGVDLAKFAMDVDRTAERAAWGFGPEDFVVVFVSSLKTWHGGLTLARAFARLDSSCPRARLLVVGDGPERDAMENELSRAGVRGHAHFTGFVAHEEIPKYYAASDAAVAPYLHSPNFYFSPLKVFEAMAARMPLVASRIGQVAEVLEHESSALLVEPGNAEHLADALMRLASHPELRRSLAVRAHDLAESFHSWDRAAEKIETNLSSRGMLRHVS